MNTVHTPGQYHSRVKVDAGRCSYLVQRGQGQQAPQKSSYMQRAVPPLIYSCFVGGFEGCHKPCPLGVPTCNDSRPPPSHHHRFTCGRGYRGKEQLAVVGPSPLRHVGKAGLPPPPVGFFGTDQQPTYHAHSVLWGIEFLVARAPKPFSGGAQKQQPLTISGAWLQAKGEVQGKVDAPEAPPPLPKLGMHYVGS